VTVRTKPVQDVPVRTTVSQYHLFLENGPPDSTMLYVREVCDTMSNVDSVMHEVGCTEICGVSPTKNQSGKRPLRGKKTRKILEKILRTYY
jgi:hypothetical protein